MSEQEILRQRGEILAELEQVRLQLEHNRTAARRLAQKAEFIATRLRTKPEELVFANEETDLRFQTNDEADLNLDEVKKVRDRIRVLLIQKRELDRQNSGSINFGHGA